MDTTLLLIFAAVAFFGAVIFMAKRIWLAGYLSVLSLTSMAILSLYIAFDQNSFSGGVPESYARIVFILAVAGLIYGFVSNRKRITAFVKRLTAKTEKAPLASS